MSHMGRGLAVILGLIVTTVAVADELLMKNGSKLIGTVVSAGEDKLVFDTPFAGEITVAMANVTLVTTATPVTLLLDNGSVYRNQQIAATENRLTVLTDKENPVTFDVLDIALVNPEPWRLGEGYKWFGTISVALESERGNTDSDELDMALESIWRSLKDRFTIRGSWEIDETNGEKSKNNWKLRNKYDRFSKQDPDNYYGVQAYFEHDEFADLDLRTMVGPYIGRQFFESDYLSLQGEVGLVYVDEQFDVAEDDDYWGSNWEFRLTSGIIPRTELYLNQTGVLNLEDTGSSIVNTTVGIKLPVLYGFIVGAEAKYEYDGGAVDGVDTTDETFNVRLGYEW